ncbi:site-specific integrase [Vibrio mediterranei]|uniref:site-specific integrase n=1 Tax=Vibrio mediterranei TaxID=689 RepID=UPI001EFEEED9|nr:site-specific integrase [Vibrio mediterranei]MCG9665820.1 site-specific integrase [Vibrio mediterranei]
MSGIVKGELKKFDVLYLKYKKFIGLKEFKVLYELSKYQLHKGVAIKTIQDQMNIICKMVSIKDKRINKWSKEDAVDVYYKIYEMPDTRELNAKEKKKKLSEFFYEYGNTSYKRIAVSTANKRLRCLKLYAKWLVDYGYLQQNLLDNLKPITEKEKECRKRISYTESDLGKIFSDRIYINYAHENNYRYWATLIAAFMGLRQNEIAQLYKRDIIHEEGVWAISVQADGDSKRVKNKNAIRKIPVPEKLIELGFIDFTRSIDEGQLFRELKYCEINGYARYLSRWFSDKKKEWGYGKEYNFHSFRHYFTNNLKQNGVRLCIASEITGHGYDSVAYERYGKEYSLRKKKKILDKNTSKTLKKLNRVYPKKKKSFLQKILFS